MDKAEYRIATEEIKRLISLGEYAEASHIADTIDWNRVKSVMMLCTVSDLYKVNRRYEDAKELLYMAYERNPESRTILYSLCDLSIKLEEFVAAIEYYKAFIEVAPKDSGRYVLQYRLYQAQDVSLEERIEVLQQLKKEEYIEKWAYELAYLYHRIGLGTECVDECDELILWFGKGRYVYKAMELKMLHEPLTPAQQYVYDRRFEQLEQAKDMTRVLPRIDSGDSQMTDESMVDVTDAPTVEIPQEYLEEELPPQEEIHVKTLDVANNYNTINLQKELAESLKEILEVSNTESAVDASMEKEEAEYDADPIIVKQQTASSISDYIKNETQDIFAQFDAEKQRDLFDILDENEEDSDWESQEIEESEVSEIETPEVEETEENSEMESEVSGIETPEVEETEENSEMESEVSGIETPEVEETEENSEMESEVSELENPEAEKNIEVSETAECNQETKSLETVAIPANEVEEKAMSFKKYASFIRSVDTEMQIMNVWENAAMEAAFGNVSVTGHDQSTCFEFIKVLVNDLKKQGMVVNGKTAKISAVNLNKKEPSEIMGKVQGGILIIERAGRLRKNTVEKLMECIQSQLSEILVFLTDTKQGMNRLFERNSVLYNVFELRVDIKDYTSDELIEHALKYAHNKEYSVDELGMLALRTRIEEILYNDEALTLEDAESIIDEAIVHVDRKTLKHFMDIFMHRRYDNEDMIILTEADFLHEI